MASDLRHIIVSHAQNKFVKLGHIDDVQRSDIRLGKGLWHALAQSRFNASDLDLQKNSIVRSLPRSLIK